MGREVAGLVVPRVGSVASIEAVPKRVLLDAAGASVEEVSDLFATMLACGASFSSLRSYGLAQRLHRLRRALRPSQECREPTDSEWDEFLGHFAQRELELDACGRAYGSGCQHEHACIRWLMLRPDPSTCALIHHGHKAIGARTRAGASSGSGWGSGALSCAQGRQSNRRHSSSPRGHGP